jgi:heme A synthase
MREHRFAVATAAATFALLVVGGLVHATGSSLACPDWPLCSGQYFPRMEGGVLYEHGHRLAALTVALLTASLAVLVFRRRGEPRLRALAALAVFLVLFQAALGALTVVLRLPLLVSASHLATSMAFFSLVIYLAWRLRPSPVGPAPSPAPSGVRRLAGLAAAATYLQIVLGAFVRHTGAGLACNVRIPLCEGALWPAWGPARLHMAHRLLGVAVALLVAAAAAAALRALPRGARLARALAWAAPALVLLQVAVGFWTVTSFISIPVVTLHVALGAALLANTLTLLLLLGPRGAASSAPGAVPAGLAPAAG